MSDLFQDIQAKLKDLVGGWASYAALGSFLLYVFGYLSIRFHLTTLGLGTDLAVLDERYVFAGAKFLVYLFATFPIVLMIALILALLAAVINRAYRYLTRKKNKSGAFAQRLKSFFTPNRVAILGIVISVLLIQIVMRKCFFFSNVLLEGLPDDGIGLRQLLLDEDDEKRSLFFVALVAGTTVCAILCLYARRLEPKTSIGKFLIGLLAFLVVVQFLFLPINYGVFIMDKAIPRVSDLGDQVSLPPNQKAWLVWEGSQGLTYLVHEVVSENAPQNTASSQTSKPSPSPVSPAQAVSPNSAAPSPSIVASPAPTATSNANVNPTVAANSPSPATSASPQVPNPVQPAASSPTGVTRKLVTLNQKDLKRTEILGYDGLSTLSFCR
jgi:hypothetical protein